MTARSAPAAQAPAPASDKRRSGSRLLHAMFGRQRSSIPLEQARLIVVDVETTGLQVRRDPLLSVGAVVIEGLRLDLSQQFERHVRADTTHVLDNILIHGLTPSDILRGEEPRQVLAEFIEFSRDSPLLAFRAMFDEQVLRRSCRQHLGIRLRNTFIDIAELAPVLFPDRQPRTNTLDAWLTEFGIAVSVRHNAAADALATAEFLLVLLHAARRQGIQDVDGLRRKIAIYQRHRIAQDQGV